MTKQVGYLINQIDFYPKPYLPFYDCCVRAFLLFHIQLAVHEACSLLI
jgi:hypothetical protein